MIRYTKTSKASKNGRFGCRRFQKSTLSRFSRFSQVIRGNPGKYDINHMSWHCPNTYKCLFWPNTSINWRNIYLKIFQFCVWRQETRVFGTFQPGNFSTLSNFDAFEADAFGVLVYFHNLGIFIQEMSSSRFSALKCSNRT